MEGIQQVPSIAQPANGVKYFVTTITITVTTFGPFPTVVQTALHDALVPSHPKSIPDASLCGHLHATVFVFCYSLGVFLGVRPAASGIFPDQGSNPGPWK